jgi:hypothetical protein
MYERLWDLFWKPLGVLAKFLMRSRSLQRSQMAPYLFGMRFGRWPEAIPAEEDISDDELEELIEKHRELMDKKRRQ